MMRRLLPILLLATFASGAVAGPEVNRLKLRAQAVVYGDTVTLADVLVLAQADQQLVQRIGDQPVLANLRSQAKTVVSHEQIVRRLDELGVNLSRVLVSGAMRCEVTLRRDAHQPARLTSSADGQAALLLREPGSRAAEGQRSLTDVLRGYVDGELSALRGTAELQFERAGREFLELTAPPWEFNVSSSGKDKLGLREFRVVIRQNGRVQRTARVFAQVRLARQVVVARRPLSIGNFIRGQDVGLETRVFESSAKLGFGSVAEVVGQQIKRFVRSGEMVCADAVKCVDLVRRSRPVTVLGDGTNVQLRLTGVALDSGGYGDNVRVRLGNSRKTRQQLHGIVTGLGTVRLVEGHP